MPHRLPRRAFSWVMKMIEQNNYLALLVVAAVLWFGWQWAWGMLWPMFEALFVQQAGNSEQIQLLQQELDQMRQMQQFQREGDPLGVDILIDRG